MSGIDAALEALLRPAADALAGFVFLPIPIAGAEVPLVVLWLVAGALFFTLRFRFVSVRGFRHALRLVGSPRDSGSSGEISHFHALSTAVSGTVGIGNAKNAALLALRVLGVAAP